MDSHAYEPLPPEAPPPGPWSERLGPTIAAGLVALLIGGVVGYLIGQGSETKREPAGTATVTNTTTVPRTVVQTHTASTVKEVPSAANQANEARLREAESSLRRQEKENRELRRQLEESGPSP